MNKNKNINMRKRMKDGHAKTKEDQKVKRK